MESAKERKREEASKVVGQHPESQKYQRLPARRLGSSPSVPFAFSLLRAFHSQTGRPRCGGVLIWTLMGLFVLSITLASASTAFYEIARLGRRNRERVVALQVGQRKLEEL